MLISLHEQATTTPRIKAAIQASDEPAWVVAERYGIWFVAIAMFVSGAVLFGLGEETHPRLNPGPEAAPT